MLNKDKFEQDVRHLDGFIYTYRSKSWYTGPAIKVKDINDFSKITEVDCRWDACGDTFIIYPHHPYVEYKDK